MASFIDETLANHSPGFILTALVVVAAMSMTVVILRRQAAAHTGSERVFWAAAVAGVAGIGVWTTHFVAMLGFRPDAQLGYDGTLTLASALLAVTCVGGPLAASCYVRRRPARMLCGLFSGLGVGLMHFTGMLALRGCLVTHDRGAGGLAFVFGAVFLAVALAPAEGRGRGALSAALMALGVCALHFTALLGLRLTPMAGAPGMDIDTRLLSALVAFGALGLCGMAFAAIHAEARVNAERRQARDTQARQDEIFSLALRNMSNGLVMLDAEERVSAVNRRALELLGIDEAEVRPGMPFASLLRAMGRRGQWTEGEREEFVADHGDWLRSEGSAYAERRFGDGRVIRISLRRMPEGGYVLTYDDLSDYREAQRAIAHMAQHDGLTGLPNRRRFREEVRRIGELDREAAVLILALDRFKGVNDTLGYATGDALLLQVGERLRAACPAEYGVFRLGGDEFAIIAPGMGAAKGHGLAERMRAVLEPGFTVEGHEITLSCSVGIAATERGDPRKLLEMADLALHRAKVLGGGRIEAYEHGMIERAIERARLELDLGAAITGREFTLRYQPLRALPGSRIVGFEALIRWEHPTRGLVSPGEFIPIAEHNGMILDIGAWVLDTACAQLARWPADIEIAVNASAMQLREPDFLAQVANALGRHGVAAHRLVIELTETALVEDGRQISGVLRNLRKLGVRVAMDDFGTGYSSLAHLRDFEIDEIKIDRSFISAGSGDVGARAVVRAVTGLARDLSIATVGEGVETVEQINWLIEVGCDIAQGYYVGKPLSESEASRLVVAQMFEDDLAREQENSAERGSEGHSGQDPRRDVA